ncbi:hypothetical protein JW707_02570 [Candidatus Woesearchaeota archaeon]|nr:hypothetical protein [Candidatus Woesearchaeota archaeon]
MGGKDFIAVVLIVFLSLWSMLYLETSLENYFMLELLVLVLFLIISTGILYSIFVKKEWAWGAAAVYFAAAVVNSVFLYFGTKSLTPFLVALLSNIAGIALAGSTMSGIKEPAKNSYMERSEIPDAFEEYDLEADSILDSHEQNARKKGAKKSGGKKKKKR